MATIVMSEMLSNAPFDDVAVGEDSFTPINDLVGVPVEFYEVKDFENDKGPGLYILFKDEKGLGYTTTHSGALISIFAKPEIREVLDRGDSIKGTIVQRKSKKTGNTYFAVE